MTGPGGNGGQDRLTLGFLDPELEARYQIAAGAESLNGFRAIAVASGFFWTLAAIVVPIGTRLALEVASPVALAMALISFAIAVVARRAATLNRQHALATLLTCANAIVILVLALIGN